MEAKYLNLRFTEQGKEQLKEVHAFLDKLDEAEHEMAKDARDEFNERLDYLNGFGNEEGKKARFKVELGKDWAPLSFTLTWLKWDSVLKEYNYAFNGGLIFHGGTNDPLTVTLTPQLWGIHT